MRASNSLGLRSLLTVSVTLGVLAAPSQADALCAVETPLAGTGGSGIGFGRSVAIDGNLALVCGDREAFAYSWNGSAWVQEAVLTIPGAESGFGASAALEGSTALIGLPLQDGPFADSGRALVFVRSGAGAWTLQQELTPLDPHAGDQFGTSVALDGERGLVGAPRDDTAGADAGSAYVFLRSGTSWSQSAKVLPAASGALRFGTSVALSGNTLLAGSATFLGGIFVHVENAGSWNQQAALAPALVLPSQVALDGDRAVVGGLFHALVLERTGSVWAQTAQLDATAATVALDGDVAVLGGPSCPTGPAATVYVAEGGSWSRCAELEIAGSLMPVAVSGLRALVGTRGGLACSGGLASSFALGTPIPATIAYRNAGSNPNSYFALPGSVGGALEILINLNTTGHSMGLVIGFDSPFQLTLPAGQTLLCLDLLGNGELINTGLHPGPIVSLSLSIPNNPVFAGLSLSTQALHAFGVTPFALSNAQDITIGGCQ